MIQSRRLLRSTLLGVVGAAVLLPTQAARAADLVPISATVKCGNGNGPIALVISAKVPAQTAPGEPVALTDVRVAVDFDYGFTQLPTYPDNPPTAADVQLDSVTVSVLGGSEQTVSLGGLPKTYARVATSGGYQTRFRTAEAELGDSGVVATSGARPVVLRLASAEYRYGFAYRDNGSVTMRPATCTPRGDKTDLAIIPSTGPQPSAPQIESISPAEASAAGGDTITVKGKHFSAVHSVLFNASRWVTPTIVDDETLTFTAPVIVDPVYRGDTVAVSVSGSFGASGTALFSWGGPRQPDPTITSVSPNRLPATGGPAIQEFDLKGSGFDRILGYSFIIELGDGSTDSVYVDSVSDDGTSARVGVNRGDWNDTVRSWPVGKARFRFEAVGPCATVACSTADTPGDDVEFYDPTATPSPTPSPSPTPVPVSDYVLSGSAALKTLTKGPVPLNGSLTGVSVAAGSGALSGTLALNPASANLTALGFLPVKAQVAFVASEPVAGTLASDALKATAKLRIKLPKVSVLGIELAGGANCQTKQITSVALSSTGAFTAADGGSLAGTFAIGNLTGCGFLTGLVSPLTSGSGNALALAVKPKR